MSVKLAKSYSYLSYSHEKNSFNSKKDDSISFRAKITVYNLAKDGKYYLKHKKWEQAEEIFSKLVECDDEYWIGLGQSLIGQEKYQQALECYEYVLPKINQDIDPIYEIFKGLCICYLFSNDNEAAQEYLNKARFLKRSLFDKELALTNGILLKNKGQYKEAQEVLQKILEKDMKCVEAWIYIAEVRAFLGDIDMAYMNLQKALDLHPENKTALKIKVRLSSVFEQSSKCKRMFSFRL